MQRLYSFFLFFGEFLSKKVHCIFCEKSSLRQSGFQSAVCNKLLSCYVMLARLGSTPELVLVIQPNYVTADIEDWASAINLLFGIYQI